VKGNISKDTLFDIKLCVEEAVRNAILHGNKSDKNLTIDISYVIEGDKIKVTIEDKGNGFNVGDLPNPTNMENLYKESGRGVYIMRRLMDRVDYNEKGNCVTMEKKLEG
ncbi:MAG: ATP-binding protein, partial [Candidatus Omnitrophica bacterium]|nr:ATP-binding protein [Candidatus Omnitrophota bacterium]